MLTEWWRNPVKKNSKKEIKKELKKELKKRSMLTEWWRNPVLRTDSCTRTVRRQLHPGESIRKLPE